ncbi:hypothetical protein TIFTF001_003811 [Ficus carica]|uniref:Uncharacterized protein n=1 Tax=Ficus carica TaxID=3494 RepID=A0AA87ZAK4_FICCA|nr:hypothetical protein TIFTF001_003811 [Ficus carica]
MDTPMLKSVEELMSEGIGRALARKITISEFVVYSLFIGAFRGPGCYRSNGPVPRVPDSVQGTVGWLSRPPAGVDPVRVECGPGRPLPILDTLLGVRRSEHNLARYAIQPGETVRSSRVLRELRMVGLPAPKPGRQTFTFTFPEHGRKQYFVVGAGHDINISPSASLG